jgi:electron transport complex protein RnfG
MLKKKDIIEIIKTGLILFLITAVSAGLLAAVNAKTAPIIEKNEKQKQQEAMKIVLPEAESFDDMNLVTDKMDKIISAVYKGSGDSGYVVMASPSGYGGEISIAVGVSSNGKVSGVSVVSQSETAGLGAKCTDDEFISQFTGKSENITVSKGNAKDNQINAISSATITSKAVTSGVNAAIEAAKIAKEGN